MQALRAVDLAPPTEVGDLRPGLLLFFARPSLLQWWAEFFGHEWRHVGVTLQTESGLMIASFGPKGRYELHSPDIIMGRYTRVGVAAVFSNDAELRMLHDWCRDIAALDKADTPYCVSGPLVGPLHLYARQRDAGVIRWFLMLIICLYCTTQDRRYSEKAAFVCSTFAWAAVHAARIDPLRLPLSAHPLDEAAYATPTNDRDELLARWLCGPTELWRAISPLNRTDLNLVRQSTKVDIDVSVAGRLGSTWIEEVASSEIQPAGHDRLEWSGTRQFVAVAARLRVANLLFITLPNPMA